MPGLILGDRPFAGLKGFEYSTRHEGDGEYPIYCRRATRPDAAEEIILNGNEIARGHAFFDLGAVSVSSGEDIVAFATDTVGRRFYDSRFRELKTGRLLPEEIPADDRPNGSTWDGALDGSDYASAGVDRVA